jgi:hypothetical protein
MKIINCCRLWITTEAGVSKAATAVLLWPDLVTVAFSDNVQLARLSSINPQHLGGYLFTTRYLYYYISVPISFNPMSNNPPPELKLLFETALNEFENRAGTNLVRHQIVDKLVNCVSADSVIDVLQEQAQAFSNFRGNDGILMKWLKRTINVLYTLSTSAVLSEGIGLVCVYLFYGHAPHNI